MKTLTDEERKKIVDLVREFEKGDVKSCYSVITLVEREGLLDQFVESLILTSPESSEKVILGLLRIPTDRPEPREQFVLAYFKKCRELVMQPCV